MIFFSERSATTELRLTIDLLLFENQTLFTATTISMQMVQKVISIQALVSLSVPLLIFSLFFFIISIQTSFAQTPPEAEELTNQSNSTNLTNPVNNPPTANNDSYVTDEDKSVNINVLANDTDIDGDSLNVTGVTDARNGTAIPNLMNNTINYTPTANFFGTDAFNYFISDNKNGTASAKVKITVSPINDKPTIANDTVATTIGVPANINVLLNDSDIDNDKDSLNVTSVTNGTNGTATINNTARTIIYTPNTNFTGQDFFNYGVSDGNKKNGNDNGTVTVKVNKVLDALKTSALRELGISTASKTFLTITFKGPPYIEENEHAAISITGKLVGVNGSTISGEEIFVKFSNQDNPAIFFQDNVTTDQHGRYEFKPNDGDANLTPGNYTAFAQPTGHIYNGTLNVTKAFNVLARPSSIPPELWAPFYGLIPAFLIPHCVGWANQWRQRKNLRRYREDIENEYANYEKSKKSQEEDFVRYQESLDKLQKKVIKALEKGSINDSHYNILKEMNSEYKKKVTRT